MILLIYCSEPCKTMPSIVQIETIYASSHNSNKYGRQHKKYYQELYTGALLNLFCFFKKIKDTYIRK